MAAAWDNSFDAGRRYQKTIENKGDEAMNILFLGSFISDAYADRFAQLSAAANQFQYNLYMALGKDHTMRALCYLPIDLRGLDDEMMQALARDSIELFRPKELGVAQEYRRFRSRMRELAAWADCVLTYNIQYPWLHISGKAKKALILADYTPVSEETGKKKAYSFLMKSSFRQYDKIVALSEESSSYANDRQQCVVVNGCIRWENFENFAEPLAGQEIVFMYSGFLGRVTGVDLLLRAFEKTTDPNYRLLISGQGDELKDLLAEAVDHDSRIVFKGYVTKEEYLQLLEESDVLVNPRNMTYQQNQYNFPSKVLEYLASGRCIVSTKFKGYEAYRDNAIFVESDEASIRDGLEAAAAALEKDRAEIYEQNRKAARQMTWENSKNLFLPEGVGY